MTAYPTVPYDPTKVMGRRILAFLVDMALCFGLAVLAVAPNMSSQLVTKSASQYRCRSDFTTSASERTTVDADICFLWGDEIKYVPQARSDRISVQIVALFSIFTLLDLVVLQSLTGAAIGKLMVGLRVIRADGQRAGPGWMAMRWFLLIIVLVMCCFLVVVDLVVAFVTKGHRRIGDFAAGTFVVRKQDVGVPPQIPGVTVPTWGAPGASWAPPGPGAPGYGPPGPPTYPPPGDPSVGGWGTPAEPGAAGPGAAWRPPSHPPEGPATPATPPPAERQGPIWDEARDTYIQWDAPRERWVQWDEHANEWKPIDQA
ncbi:MAG: RDD family protein [Acidimicrobiales bacterium]